MSTEINYALEGLSVQGGNWRQIGHLGFIEEIESEFKYYQDERIQSANGNGWKDFRIVKVAITRDVFDPSAQPVADGPAHSNLIPTAQKLESDGPAGFSDAERVDFIIEKFMAIDDVGDETFCPGVIIYGEEMADKLTLALAKVGYPKGGTYIEAKKHMRSFIDEAIRAQKKDANA